MSKSRLIIGAFAVLLFGVAWFFLVWGPQSVVLEDARKDLKSHQVEQGALSKDLRDLQAAKAKTGERQAALALLRAAIPDDPDLANFLNQADRSAKEAGVQLLSLSPSQPAAPGAVAGGARKSLRSGASVIQLSMSASGSYEQLLAFIERLEDQPRLVVIDSVNMTSGTGAEAGRMSAQVIGSIMTTQKPKVTVPERRSSSDRSAP